MIRILKVFFHDGVSWGLVLLLLFISVSGITALFERYDRVDRFKERLVRLEYDISLMEKELSQKTEWLERLESDPTAWEQVVRDKMNYLRPNEVLITFIPAREGK